MRARQMIKTPFSQFAGGEVPEEKSVARQLLADAYLDVGDPIRACILRGADRAICERQSGMSAVALWHGLPSSGQPFGPILCSGSLHLMPAAISGSAAIGYDSQRSAAIVMSGNIYTLAWASGQTWRRRRPGPFGEFYGGAQVSEDKGRLLDAQYMRMASLLSSEGNSITSGH